MLEIWKSIDEPTYLLVWILYQFWLLNLNCLASTLKFGIISTIQIGWNYSHLNIRTKFYHVLRRTFLLYLNDSMMDLMTEIDMNMISVLYLTKYYPSCTIFSTLLISLINEHACLFFWRKKMLSTSTTIFLSMLIVSGTFCMFVLVFTLLVY